MSWPLHIEKIWAGEFGELSRRNFVVVVRLWGIDVLVHFQEDREMDKADEAEDEVSARKVFYLFTLLLF